MYQEKIAVSLSSACEMTENIALPVKMIEIDLELFEYKGQRFFNFGSTSTPGNVPAFK